MNIEQFNKIKGTVDLVNKTGSDTNSIHVFNRIYDLVMTGLAEKNTKEAIKSQIEDYLDDFEIQTKSLEKRTQKLMKEWGFNFDE